MKDGGSQNNTALRTVRAKRDLDEAGMQFFHITKGTVSHDDSDKEYRKGVHWLESLRLRRTKTLESGYKVCIVALKYSSQSLKYTTLELDNVCRRDFGPDETSPGEIHRCTLSFFMLQLSPTSRTQNMTCVTCPMVSSVYL